MASSPLRAKGTGKGGLNTGHLSMNVDGSVSSLDFSPCGTKIAVACNDTYNDVYTVKILSSSSDSTDTQTCQMTLSTRP